MHTCAALVDGGARCWGNNGSGQLGDDTTIHRYTPVDVVKLDAAAWTFIAYLNCDDEKDTTICGDIFNLLEMAANNRDVRIIALWDGPGDNDSSYFKVQHDTNRRDLANYTPDVNIWHKGELDMGDPQTLVDFVTWARKEYPARYSALYMNDHGSGLGGVMKDKRSGNRISVAQLGNALFEITQAENKKIDVLFLQACLMGMIEDAYQIREFVNYYVTSENTMWGYYAEHAFTSVAAIGPTTTPAALATIFAENAVPPEPVLAQAAFIAALSLAHKRLADRDDPSGPDQRVSGHDPDARRGKPGASVTGYLLDVAMNADSQRITALDLLPANADEGADAGALMAHEEAVHGNDVETLSIDKAGFRGELLREWQDPNGLGVEVMVPPMSPPPTPYFTAEALQHDAEAGPVTCPGGVRTKQRVRTQVNTGWKYSFPQLPCRSCPLQPRCRSRLPQKTGRQVVVNDYAVAYAAARQKAPTERYREVRREHPAIERKRAELVRHHQGQRAR